MKLQKTLQVVAMLVSGLLMFSFCLIEDVFSRDQDQTQGHTQDRLQLCWEEFLYEFGEYLVMVESEDCDCLCTCCQDSLCTCCKNCLCPCCQDDLFEDVCGGDQDQTQDHTLDRRQLHGEDRL